MIAELWVPGPPKAKQRPRMTRRGSVYTPQETLQAEDAIHEAWMAAHEGTVLEGPLRAVIDYYQDGQWIVLEELGDDHKAPQRWDLDNGIKLTLDGLQAKTRGSHQRPGAFRNDSQVVELWAAKH